MNHLLKDDALFIMTAHDFVVIDDRARSMRRCDALLELVNGQFAVLLNADDTSKGQFITELYLGDDKLPHRAEISGLSERMPWNQIFGDRFTEYNRRTLAYDRQIKTVYWRDGRIKHPHLFDKEV